MAADPGEYDYGERGERILELTRELTAIHSVNGTEGEAEIGEHLHDLLRGFDYFTEHPEQLRTVEVTGTEYPTEALLALWRNPEAPDGRTALLMGHYDTVGVDDYGELADSAGDSEMIRENLERLTDDPDALADRDSGEWEFGRGWLDMKGGVAAGIETMRAACNGKLDTDCHILLLVTPDEEVGGRGIMQAVPELRRWLSEQSIDPLVAINLDFVSPLSADDDTPYVYTGSIGKLLLGVSVFGRESHVGSYWEGLPAASLAAELVAGLDGDPELAARDGERVSPPPAALHLRDAKESYDVMTPGEAHAHLNLFTFASSAGFRLERAKHRVEEILDSWHEERAERKEKWRAGSDEPDPPEHEPPEVVTARELEHMAKDTDGEAAENALEQADSFVEPRRRYFEAVSGLYDVLEGRPPLVVIGYPPPVCPPVDPDRGGEGDRERVEAALSELLDSEPARTAGLERRRWYPYISDVSYLAVPPEPLLNEWLGNSPGLAKNYAERMKALTGGDTPVVTLGPYGKDAHHVAERVHRGYLCETLPALLKEFLAAL